MKSQSKNRNDGSGPSDVEEAGEVFEAVRLKSSVKSRLEDEQEKIRKRDGRKPSLSQAVEMAIAGEFAPRNRETAAQKLADQLYRWATEPGDSTHAEIAAAIINAARRMDSE